MLLTDMASIGSQYAEAPSGSSAIRQYNGMKVLIGVQLANDVYDWRELQQQINIMQGRRSSGPHLVSDAPAEQPQKLGVIRMRRLNDVSPNGPFIVT